MRIDSGTRRFLRFLLGAVLAGLCCAFLVAGCSSETTSEATRPVDASDATNDSAGHSASTTASPQGVTSRWPAGVDAVVLTTASGLYVIDGQGIRWAEEDGAADVPSSTAIVRGRPVISGLDGLALSSDGEFVGYTRWSAEVVTRSVRDGSVVGQAAVPVNGHTTLRAVSTDGILAALVTVDPQKEAETQVDEVLWALTVVDLGTGEVTAGDALADMVRERIEGGERCGLAEICWLPERRLLVGVSGDPYETYLYDPFADSLVEVPGLGYVWSHTPGGLVLGAGAGEPGQAVVWDAADGSTGRVVLDPEWPYAVHGSLNAEGTALVLMVARSSAIAEHGWQVFRRQGTEWKPAGPAAEVDWMHQPPGLLDKDGTTAWAVSPQSTDDNETVLLSHHFPSGDWQTWFGSEDLGSSWDPFHIAGVVLEASRP